MGTPAGPAPRSALLAVLGTVGLAVVVLLLPAPPEMGEVLVASLVGLVTSLLAAGCGWWRALRSTGRHRYAWVALAAALTCPPLSVATWTWLDQTGQETFPSVSNLVYLGFGPLVCTGLLLLPVRGGSVWRLQALLDGLATSWALLLISWQTALGAAIRATEGSGLPVVAVSVAYPAIDVGVLVVTVLTLTRAPTGPDRLPIALLAAGLVAVSVTESTFIYLTATSGHAPSDAIGVSWNLGLGCLALAALVGNQRDRPRGERRDGRRTIRESIAPAGSLLPYVPVVGTLAVVVALHLTGQDSAPGEQVAVVGLVVLLLARQYLTLRQNARLVAEVADREERLHHLAFHDALTGLANRALFRDRLEHALRLHEREHRPVALLFLDLDGFKTVNDTLGHAAGDELLVRIAERLDRAARAGDTVARLGGDEFAVLLESGDDPHRAAERIAATLRGPFSVAGRQVVARASTGMVELGRHDPTATADELLARADMAMYAAKYAAHRSDRAPLRYAVVAEEG